MKTPAILLASASFLFISAIHAADPYAPNGTKAETVSPLIEITVDYVQMSAEDAGPCCMARTRRRRVWPGMKR